MCSSQNGSRADFSGQTPYLGSKQILFINRTFPYLNLCICHFTSTLFTPTIVMIRAFPAGFFIFFDSWNDSTTHESSDNRKIGVQVTYNCSIICNFISQHGDFKQFQGKYTHIFSWIRAISMKQLVRSILGLTVQTARYFWRTPLI